MSLEVPFHIDLDEALSKVVVRPADLIWGFEHQWIKQEDLVKAALHRFDELALQPLALAWDEPHRVPWIVSNLSKELRPDQRTLDVWMYIALRWVYSHRDDLGPEWRFVADSIIAEFGYPEQVRGLLSFHVPNSEDNFTPEESWRNTLTKLQDALSVDSPEWISRKT